MSTSSPVPLFLHAETRTSCGTFLHQKEGLGMRATLNLGFHKPHLHSIKIACKLIFMGGGGGELSSLGGGGGSLV